MTRPSWLDRAARNRHRHAIEQASRRWRGGRRDDAARPRRKILISTQVTFTACRLVCNMVGVRTHVRRARVKNFAEYRREKREAELRLRTCPPWFDKKQWVAKHRVPATGRAYPMDIEYERIP